MAHALDLVGERWSLLIVRELLEEVLRERGFEPSGSAAGDQNVGGHATSVRRERPIAIRREPRSACGFLRMAEAGCGRSVAV